MAWRIIEIPDENARPTDLTNGELIGVSVLLTHHAGEPRNEVNVYWRAREKLQENVERAIEHEG
jgi:hypothetical protein